MLHGRFKISYSPQRQDSRSIHKIEEEERRSQNEDEVTGPQAAGQEENIDQQVAATDDDMDIWDLAGANLTPMFGPEE